MKTAAPLIPTEDFFADPAAAGATISPDGARLAYLAPEGGRMNLWVADLDGSNARCVSRERRRGISRYQWSDDPRWLLFQQDVDGDENWHVHRVDLFDEMAPIVDLTPFAGARVDAVSHPGHLTGTLYAAVNRRRPDLLDVIAIDVASGEVCDVAVNSGEVGAWFWGPDGEVYAVVVPPTGGLQIRAWEQGVGLGRLVTELDPTEALDIPLALCPVRVTPDGTGIWLGSSRDHELTRVVRVDVATGERVVIDSHSSLDLDTRASLGPGFPYPLLFSRRSGELVAIRYLGDRQELRILDPSFGAVIEAVQQLSDGDIAGISSDPEERVWVVSFTHDTEPGVTFIYDHLTGESRELFRSHPQLDSSHLASMRPVSITARDGLRLPAYLTLPVGVEPKKLPMVLVVHGGPWFRDSWGFAPTVQFLANRGYAVLQVNMRGSIGYGRSFVRAAVKEFAGAMHDDLIDACDWAVGRGYAASERIAIFGGSYGGYSALLGITHTPGRFAAAVDYCGISDLANFIRTIPPYWRNTAGNSWYAYIGDPQDPVHEADMLARSPISRIHDVRTPVLVAQGANDVRVVRAESDNVVAALRACGAEVEYLVCDDEGHGFQNSENQVQLFDRVQRFLDKHMVRQ